MAILPQTNLNNFTMLQTNVQTSETTANVNPLQSLVNDSQKIIFPPLSLTEKIQLIEKMYLKQLRAKDKEKLVYYFGTSEKSNLITINLPSLIAQDEKERNDKKEREEKERKESILKNERKSVNLEKTKVNNEILTQLLKDNKAFDFMVNYFNGQSLDQIINSNLLIDSQRAKVNPLQLEQLMKSWNLTRGHISKAQDDKVNGLNERGRNFMSPIEIFNVWVKASCLKSTTFDEKKTKVFLEKVSNK